MLSNCQALAGELQARGYTLVTGGTDNHLVLVDVRPKGVDGSRVERVMELAHIAVNKNTVPGDTSALVPGGVRLGTPALTTRGFGEADFVVRCCAGPPTTEEGGERPCLTPHASPFQRVAEFVDRAVRIAVAVKTQTGGKLKDFRAALDASPPPELAQLRHEVEAFATQFPTIGFERATMKYTD